MSGSQSLVMVYQSSVRELKNFLRCILLAAMVSYGPASMASTTTEAVLLDFGMKTNNAGTFIRLGKDLTYRRYGHYVTPALLPTLGEWLARSAVALTLANALRRCVSNPLYSRLVFLGTFYGSQYAWYIVLHSLAGKRLGTEQIHIDNQRVSRLVYLELAYSLSGDWQQVSILPYPEASEYGQSGQNRLTGSGPSGWEELHGLLVNNGVTSLQLEWMGMDVINGISVTIRLASGQTLLRVVSIPDIPRSKTVEHILHGEQSPGQVLPQGYDEAEIYSLLDEQILFEVIPGLIESHEDQSALVEMAGQNATRKYQASDYSFAFNLCLYPICPSHLQLQWQLLPYPHYRPVLVLNDIGYQNHGDNMAYSLTTQVTHLNLAEQWVHCIEMMVFVSLVESVSHIWYSSKQYPKDNTAVATINAIRNRDLSRVQSVSPAEWRTVLQAFQQSDERGLACDFLYTTEGNKLVGFFTSEFLSGDKFQVLPSLALDTLRAVPKRTLPDFLEQITQHRPEILYSTLKAVPSITFESLSPGMLGQESNDLTLKDVLESDELKELTRTLIDNHQGNQLSASMVRYINHLPVKMGEVQVIILMIELELHELFSSGISMDLIRKAIEGMLQENYLAQQVEKVREWSKKANLESVKKFYATKPPGMQTPYTDQVIWDGFSSEEALSYIRDMLIRGEAENFLRAQKRVRPEILALAMEDAVVRRSQKVQNIIDIFDTSTIDSILLNLADTDRVDVGAGYRLLVERLPDFTKERQLDLAVKAVQTRRVKGARHIIIEHGLEKAIFNTMLVTAKEDVPIIYHTLSAELQRNYLDHLFSLDRNNPQVSTMILLADRNAQMWAVFQALYKHHAFKEVSLGNAQRDAITEAVTMYMVDSTFDDWQYLSPGSLYDLLRHAIEFREAGYLRQIYQYFATNQDACLKSVNKLDLQPSQIQWLAETSQALITRGQLDQHSALYPLARIAQKTGFVHRSEFIEPLTPESRAAFLTLLGIDTEPVAR
ncbi:MAG: hypothetical protein ACR2PT_17155 [Endozoicomonas sp.]